MQATEMWVWTTGLEDCSKYAVYDIYQHRDTNLGLLFQPTYSDYQIIVVPMIAILISVSTAKNWTRQFEYFKTGFLS